MNKKAWVLLLSLGTILQVYCFEDPNKEIVGQVGNTIYYKDGTITKGGQVIQDPTENATRQTDGQPYYKGGLGTGSTAGISSVITPNRAPSGTYK